MRLRLPPRTPIAALGCFVALFSGCVDVDGGAVEVSWVVHANGRAITDCGCADPIISKVRIHLEGRGGAIEGTTPCADRAQCEFSCQRQTGATPFDIRPTRPDEAYAVSVIAVGPDGEDLPGVIAPAPILRTVMKGQPTELGAFLLEAAGCNSQCESMNKTGVCARP
jgi:hypothetical protein